MFTASAGALVRVTLRGPLESRVSVSFTRRGGAGGSARRSLVIRGRKRINFLFSGDARGLTQAIVRTTHGSRASTRIPRSRDDCAALARLAAKLRPLRKGRPAISARLRAIARRRSGPACTPAIIPADPGPAPAPAPAPGFTPAAARFTLPHGFTPEDPLTAGADVAFADASQGTGLVDWAWNFGDGATAAGTLVHHTFATPDRHTVLLAVRNARGDVSSYGQDVFIRGPGSLTTNGGAVRCPNPGETIPVTVRVRVPSWAKLPAQVGYTIASGPCAPDASGARDLTITPGNTGDHKDAWGRSESTLQFSFDLSDGTGTGTVDPSVTASWS